MATETVNRRIIINLKSTEPGKIVFMLECENVPKTKLLRVLQLITNAVEETNPLILSGIEEFEISNATEKED